MTSTVTEAIRKWRPFLEERMDPDFGLLNDLLAGGTINVREISEVKSKSSSWNRNAQLLDYILDKDGGDGLIKALRDSSQIHIANYLTADGEYADAFGGEWPLTDKEIKILDINSRSLVDLLDLLELLGLLYSSKVINNRQKDLISSKPTSHEKNEALLEILRRRSLRDYRQTIICLRQSKQSHIAETLEKGGVVVRTHVNLDGKDITEAENEIVTNIANLLNDRSIDQSSRILELAHHRVIAAKTGQSIVLYIYCKTIKELEQLSESLVSRQLKESVELWFNLLSNLSQKVVVSAITVSDEEFEKMRTYIYFKEREISRRSIKSRHSDDVGETKNWLNETKNWLSETKNWLSETKNWLNETKNWLNETKNWLKISATEEIKLRAIKDFDPSEIRHRERIKFESFLKKQGLAHLINDENESQSIDRQGNNDVDPIPFKRGDTMETIHPVTIGDNVGWWKVRHLISGKTGFIPRNRVVIAANDHQSPSKTTLYDLPLELLDTVFENSFLHSILNCSPQQKNEDVIKVLTSVDFCWFQRLTRQRFKKRIWHRLKDFYGKIKRRSEIIRNNQSYLLENIQTNDKLFASLLSLNCITDEQRRVIQQQRSIRIKNFKLVDFMRSFDQINLSNFVKCLRRTHPTQRTVARIIENGGVAIKVEVQNRRATCKTSLKTQKTFHQKFVDLGNRTIPWTNQTDKLISELKEEGVEILNSQLDRQTVVVWIWCHSQSALQYIQNLYESNQLRNVLSGLANIPPEFMQSKVINVYSKQFMKTVVVCPISISLTEKIDLGVNERARGVTELRNEIYVLCSSASDDSCAIRVFDDRNPFQLQRKIELKEIKRPISYRSSEKENCLYISDADERCIWKITRESDDQHKIVKWLTLEKKEGFFSISRDNHLLLLGWSPSTLMIYGSDATLLRSIPLPTEINNPFRIEETSTGNFIILYLSTEDEEDENTEDKEVDAEERVGLPDGIKHIEEKEAKKEKELQRMEDRKEEEENEEKKNDDEDDKEDEEEKEKIEEKVEEKVEEVEEDEEKEESDSEDKAHICEVTSDGKIVIRRFIPSNEMQKMNRAFDICLDADDQVFVDDRENGRVILLDSDLKWNQILTKEGDDDDDDDDREFKNLGSLFYDEETNQLIVAGVYQPGVIVYNIG